MEDAIDIVVEELQPRYVHFGDDEPQQIFTCEECREIVPEEGVTEPGQLFADSINTLVGYYEDACIAEYGSAAFEQGQKDGYYRTMIYADHVSTPHEEYKVPSPPGNWWYYRGSTIPKWISTCKTEIEKSVIMADWNYITEDEDLPSLPLLKYRYIDDLTDAGFDVVGVSEGHANHGGGIERVDPWAGATVSCDLEYRNEELDLTIYKQFNGLAYEGTMQHYLPLYNADIELYGSSQYWFTREEFGGYRNHRIQIPDINTNPLYETYPTAAWLSCDIRGKSAQGEVWFDDLELSWKNEEALNWRPLVRPEEDNGDFDDEGSGNRTFDEWDDPPLLWNDTVRAEVAYDDDIHRDVSPGPDTASCKFFIDVINEADLENPISHPTSFIAGEEVLIDDFTQTRGYVRTREVDTLRLGCPRQWMDCGLKFEQAMAITYGTYLGAVLNLTRGLPFDDRPFVVGWKSNADAIGIADYNWSPRFPRTPYLKYLWWDPYVTCLKEVTW
ncbi:MAG: hypothetical protein GY771_12905 [bacterium]|nr:hypothetical protein [bacterium]